MSSVSSDPQGDLTAQAYNLFGYRFAFQTEEPNAARRVDTLYGAFRDESAPSEATYQLLRSGPEADGAGWSAHLADGEIKTASLLQDALYSVEVGICAEVMENANGRHGIHGAVVYGPGGDLLISGVSGAGKTTLSLALAARGLRVAGDDAALLDPETHLIEALPRNFHLDEHSVSLLEDMGLTLPEEGRRYRFVTPADLGVVNPPPARIRFVFLLEPERDAQLSIRPQTQAEMAAALLMETGRGDFTDVEGVHALSGLIGQADSYRVRSGQLSETADAIVRIVSGRPA